MVNTKCPNCGVAHNCNFCPNCGVPARILLPPSLQTKPGRNRYFILLIIPVLVVIWCILIFFFFNIIFDGDKINTTGKTMKQADLEQSEFQQVTGASPDQEAFIIEILSGCGIDKIDTIAHDEMLDNMNEDGETGYRIKTGEINIILYLHADKTVNMVRYADNDLYAEGEVKSVISDFVLTWQEESDLQIICQNLIETILKSPSTAKFPGITKWTMWKQDGEIYVQSYVDAQNAFGAELRSEFQFILTKERAVKSLIFDGEEMVIQ